MKRSPLRRKTRLSPKRATVRRSSRVLDEAYLAWVRLQPCAVGKLFEFVSRQSAVRATPDLAARLASDSVCWGPVDPEHKREGVGMGQKASDRDAWPCCRGHHDQRHNTASGAFKNWTRAQLNEFIDARIAEANAAYELHLKQAVPA